MSNTNFKTRSPRELKKIVDDISENDFVILVYGTTGVGKSTFIRAASGDGADWVVIGHTMDSQTSEIGCTKFSIPGFRRRIVLVDMPGFDDPGRTDGKVLEILATWLRDLGEAKKLINGIIYLHRITEERYTQGAAIGLNILKNLYGPAHYNRITIATTFWDEVKGYSTAEAALVEAENRQKYLIDKVWTPLFRSTEQNTDLGAIQPPRYARFDAAEERAHDSAVEIITDMIKRAPNYRGIKLRIQEQMVDQGLALRDTDAGKVISIGSTDFLRNLVASVGVILRSGVQYLSSAIRNYPWSTRRARANERRNLAFAVAPASVTPDDYVIWVYGLSGSGRSTFITHLAGQSVPGIEISHSMWSGTYEIVCVNVPVLVPNTNRRIIVVDTPCFGMGDMSNTKVLEILSSWLFDWHKRGVRLQGVIIIQGMHHNRIPPDVLDLFCVMYGREEYNRVLLATSMWSRVDKGSKSNDREKQILANWKDAEKNFNEESMVRWEYDPKHPGGSEENAGQILLKLVNKVKGEPSGTVLEIQREMAEQGSPVPDVKNTKAGKLLKDVSEV